MELFSAALPNIMFVCGIVAIAIGLGIELKLVPVGNQVGRGGRIGAMTVGVLLVVVSVFLYIRPDGAVSATNPTAAPAAAPQSAPPVQQAIAAQPTVVAPEQPSATAVPPTAVPPTETALPPTQTPVPPTETMVPPTAVPPTETALPPTATAVPPTAVPGVAVPDVRGKGQKDASKVLQQSGLLLERHDGRCADLQVPDEEVRRGKKGNIACQSPAPGSLVEPGTVVKVVLIEQNNDD